MSTTRRVSRRGPRYPKSPVRGRGHAELITASGFASTPEAAKKSLQRLQAKVRAVAEITALHPDLKGRLREIVGSALDVLAFGAPLPWSGELVASMIGHDGAEDGPTARVVNDPTCVATVKAWLRAADAEQEARGEVIASARAWLARQQLMGSSQ